MKSKLLKTLFGLSLFALAANVNAETPGVNIGSVSEGNNKTDATVTVGDVATPVYSVNIEWDSLVFDWAYDYENNTYGWKAADVCSPVEFEDEDTFNANVMFGEVFENDSCTSAAETYEEKATYYQWKSRESAIIHIHDKSENGEIVPSVKWNASDKSDKYQDVFGRFQYREGTRVCTLVKSQDMFDDALVTYSRLGFGFYTDNLCSNEVDGIPETFESNKYYVEAFPLVDLKTAEIPDSSLEYWEEFYFSQYDLHYPIGDVGYSGRYYTLAFNLEGGSTTPTAGDEIGTITVSIRAK